MPEESLDNIYQEEQVISELSNPLWNLIFVQAYKARKEFDVNGEDVTVAVIDSGINNRHPELEGKIADAFNIGRNDRNDLEDWSRHGTIVAGVIAGNRVGIAPNVRLISIKLRQDKKNYKRDLINALEFCETSKTDIVNISSGLSEYSDLLKERCDGLVEMGVTIVASAGNEGTGAFFPASYDSVISVAAVKPDSEHWIFSNIWPTVDISAPGIDILSTYPLNNEGIPRYKKTKGTSVAAPHISGILALGISLLKKKQKEDYIPNPRLFKTVLKETAIDISKDMPYCNEAFELLERYQRYYDPSKVFLKGSQEVIRAIYGYGYARAYEFLKKLDEKA